ncbi:uncharacterized protein [Triticum aestivum]|uniref:uncharacterized protein isoform X3 n=1 Tax=Triticum aestivum TaxID=4565 RepID=UPI001D015AAF|nr:uncharacterized protein LOC123092028 isoform X3 [Triticum aestivum]
MACPPPPTRHSAPTDAAPHRCCAAPSPRVSPSPRCTDWCAAAPPPRYLKGADLAAEWFVQQQYNDRKNFSSKKYAGGGSKIVVEQVQEFGFISCKFNYITRRRPGTQRAAAPLILLPGSACNSSADTNVSAPWLSIQVITKTIMDDDGPTAAMVLVKCFKNAQYYFVCFTLCRGKVTKAPYCNFTRLSGFHLVFKIKYFLVQSY